MLIFLPGVFFGWCKSGAFLSLASQHPCVSRRSRKYFSRRRGAALEAWDTVLCCAGVDGWTAAHVLCCLCVSVCLVPVQDRMHLDCVFSVLGEKCCIMLETIIGDDSPSRRLVDEYVRDPKTGKYKMER